MMLRLLLLAAKLVIPFLLAGSVFVLGSVLYPRWKYRHLPSPKRQWRNLLFGAITEIQEISREGGHLAMLYQVWAKECGTVFVVFLANRPLIVCLEPSVVRELLISGSGTHHKQFYAGFHTTFGQRFLPHGLLSELNDQRWAMKRKMMDPAFKRSYLKDLIYQFSSCADGLISHLEPKANRETEVLMADAFHRVACGIIAKVAFGLNIDPFSDDASPLYKGVLQILAGNTYQTLNPFIWQLDFRSKTRSFIEKTVRYLKLLRETGKKCILDRIEVINTGSEYPKDILTHILQISNNSKEFGLEEMVDEFLMFFVAGQETTAGLMSFTFELVGRDHKVYKKMQEEVDRVIGKKKDLTFEDLSKLEYMSMVLKEVLRYAPPVIGVRQTNLEEFVINGFKIPAGSPITLSHYALGRDERYWDNPEEFNPERFRAGNRDRNFYAHFPFSLGPRSCIGQQFALIEARVILARLFQTFDYQLVPGVELHYTLEGILKTTNGTPITLTSRNEE